MKIFDGLTKAVAHFDGGFGWAHMSADGATWSYHAVSAALEPPGRIAKIEGRQVMESFVVQEHGHERGFALAIMEMRGLLQPQEAPDAL